MPRGMIVSAGDRVGPYTIGRFTGLKKKDKAYEVTCSHGVTYKDKTISEMRRSKGCPCDKGKRIAAGRKAAGHEGRAGRVLSIKTGDVVGPYVVLERDGYHERLTGKKEPTFRVMCKEHLMKFSHFTVRVIKRDTHCRCEKAKRIKESRYRTHGMAGDGERLTYDSWDSMKRRCLDPNNRKYKDYGAKGIKPCQYLKESPKNLLALLGERPKEFVPGTKVRQYTIDRHPITTGGYWCGQCEECRTNGWARNVRWATKKQQRHNQVDHKYSVKT